MANAAVLRLSERLAQAERQITDRDASILRLTHVLSLSLKQTLKEDAGTIGRGQHRSSLRNSLLVQVG